MTVHYLTRVRALPPETEEPASERFSYLDSIPVQLGFGALVLSAGVCVLTVSFAHACVAYGVDAVIRGVTPSKHHHREG